MLKINIYIIINIKLYKIYIIILKKYYKYYIILVILKLYLKIIYFWSLLYDLYYIYLYYNLLIFIFLNLYKMFLKKLKKKRKIFTKK